MMQFIIGVVVGCLLTLYAVHKPFKNKVNAMIFKGRDTKTTEPAVQPVQPKTIECRGCGTVVSRDDVFCPKCGEILNLKAALK